MAAAACVAAVGDEATAQVGMTPGDVSTLFTFPATLPEVPEELPVYPTQPPVIDSNLFNHLASRFGLAGQPEEDYPVWRIRDKERVLEASVQAGTGYLRYTDEEAVLAAAQPAGLPTDDEAVAMAQALFAGSTYGSYVIDADIRFSFPKAGEETGSATSGDSPWVSLSPIEDLGEISFATATFAAHAVTLKSREYRDLAALQWLPEGASPTDVAHYEFAIFDADGQLLSEGVTAVSVLFTAPIGDLPVVGPGAKISAAFGQDGRLVGAARAWRDVGEAALRASVSLDTAISAFKDLWPPEKTPQGPVVVGSVSLGDDEANTPVAVANPPSNAAGVQFQEATTVSVVVENVYIALYAGPPTLPVQLLEPIFVFEGYSELLDDAGQPAGGFERFVHMHPAVQEVTW